jgi:alpha-methylacyl-CoA racemase
MAGPLNGIRILEIAGIGPGPFCAMMLADQGAEVIRIDRAAGHGPGVSKVGALDYLNRSRRSIAVDLKNPEGVALVMEMIATADGLIEGFRPGVMERLGLGPDAALKRNPRLVYGRMTGWGQDGPMAQAAGHDINYIALAGALHAFGRAGERPTPPINMVGDFGGGGMLLAFGMVCALLEAKSSGAGQVVDAAMVDGSATLMMMIHALMAMGLWRDERGVNLLDTGAHFYEVYETSDGKFISLGAIEPRFYAEFLKRAGLESDPDFAKQLDNSRWPALKRRLEAHFKTRTQAQWCQAMEASDACFAPVLSLTEAPQHPHLAARGTFIDLDGVQQPAPSPRFSRTPADFPRRPDLPGQSSRDILQDLGLKTDRIDALLQAGVVRQG